MTDPYERLANAIIISAVRDYRSALKRLKKNPRSRDAMQEAMECERFFHSRWYSTLTAVDGDYLIDRLREEARSK